MIESLFLFMHSKYKSVPLPPLPKFYGFHVFDEQDFPANEEHEKNFKKFSRLFRALKPQAFYTYRDGVEHIADIFSPFFECRKRWLHLESFSEFSVDVHVTPNILGDIGIPGLECGKHKYSAENPLFSFFTTTFHSKHRLLRPFRSIKSQTYVNWEWILVDDSKSDDHDLTYSQIRHLADEDFRIKPFKLSQHSGYIGEMKMIAASLCNGEYLIELDHDDDVDENLCEYVRRAILKHPDADFVYCDTDEVFEETGESRSYGDFFAFGFGANQKYLRNDKWQIQSLTQGINPRTIRHIIGVPNHVRIWRRSFYESLGKHEQSLSVADDYELLVRSFLKARKWVRIPLPLYIQYVNAGGNNFTKIRNELIQHNTKHVYQKYEKDVKVRLDELKSVELPFEYCPYWHTQSFFPVLESVWHPHVTDDTISIIIPTFNRPSLVEAIRSAFNQTHQDTLVYIVGDKCPLLEETMKMLIPTLNEDHKKRVFYWNLDQNKKCWGAYSRNYALKMLCVTKWVSYLDDDNTWLPTHLSSLLQTVKEEDADFAFSGFLVEGKEIHAKYPEFGRIDSSSFLHKKDLCKYGYWPMDGKYATDWEFVKPWVSAGCKWVASGKCTLVYNTENNSQTWESIKNLVPDDSRDNSIYTIDRALSIPITNTGTCTNFEEVD